MTRAQRNRRRDTAPANHWWEIPTELLGEEVILRINAPASARIGELVEQVRDGSYQRPFIVEDSRVRRLHFGLRYLQSEMRLRAPDVLTLDYAQKIMACLLFLPRPEHLVVVGLGGGSLTRFCYRWLPDAVITTVEIDGGVIDMARSMFHLPPPDGRMNLLHQDAVDYFASPQPPADAVLLDGCDARGLAPALCAPGFHARLHTQLKPDGLLVVNLVGEAADVNALLGTLQAEYDGRVLVLPVTAQDHRVVFAFAGSSAGLWPPDWAQVRLRAEQLGHELPLDFAKYARMLERAYWRTVRS